jgi:predicted nuclease of restriction endonuclease-like (RecB) superfamily
VATKTSSKKRAPRAKPSAAKASTIAAPRRAIADGGDTRFPEVIALIESARARGYQAVNTVLVEHYWELGAYISGKIATAEWGDGVVEELAADLARHYPGVRGYTRRNLFRMRQFFEAYRAHKKVSPLVTQLPWTHHLIILSEAKPVEAREFYLLAAIKERWSKRELERQIRTGAVLRAPVLRKKVSPAVTQIHPTAIDEFKNAYNVEFLGLAADHSDADLHGALLRNVRALRELGLRQALLGARPPNLKGDRQRRVDTNCFDLVTSWCTSLDLRLRRNRSIHEVGLEPPLERLFCERGKIVALTRKGLAPGTIGKLREPVSSFTRDVRGVFHVSPATELDSRLAFDRLERADRKIFARVGDGTTNRLLVKSRGANALGSARPGLHGVGGYQG